MRIVVFGGAGFLGSHVADALTGSGHDVIVFDIRESAYVKDGQTMVIGNILDSDSVDSAVSGCDVVYNFAGIADIEECAKNPVDTVRYNILGNTIVLEASKKASVKRFVFASSAYVYSHYGYFYRSSKQACELLIENYRKLYGLPHTILRYGSLYGTRTDERNSVYRIIKEALTTGKIVYNGTGEEVRNYIHVEDAARLSVRILSSEFENEHVVLTGTESMKYRDLLNTIKEMFGNKIEIVYTNERKSESHYMMTPYSFNPRMGKKLVSDYYIEMGQGLLDCMRDVHVKTHHEKHEEGGLLVNGEETR